MNDNKNNKGLIGFGIVAVIAVVLYFNNPMGKTDAPVDINSFSAERIKADLSFLADDLLRGRETGSNDYRIAAKYVAAEYEKLGLKPAGDEGSYLQEVPFRTATLNQEKSSVSITINGKTSKLKIGDDYLMSANVITASATASAPIVYVGYGIYAPDLNHDDLSGLDLEGKIVLVVSGAPDSFQTEIRAYEQSNGTKNAEFIKRGAVGVIAIQSKVNEARRPYERLKSYLGRKSFDWLPPENDTEPSNDLVSALINYASAEKLFATVGKSVDEALTATEGGEMGGFPLNASVALDRESNLDATFTSPNVVGILEGSDPVLKNEYVVLSAHLDHLGVRKDSEGNEVINNGALDNASGVAVMLDVARAYANATTKPRRSIMFAAVTGEEKGLLGAEYLAKYPTVEKSSMVANVNLDMPVLLYDFTDVVAFGADRSSLGPIAEKALKTVGLKLSPDPMPEEGIFTRSDHFRFVQQGIPAVFLVTGFAEDTNGKNGGEIFMNFLHNTYHSPGDNLDQMIDYQAAAKFAYVNWLITNAIANDNEKPSWNEGDFFGAKFAGSK